MPSRPRLGSRAPRLEAAAGTTGKDAGAGPLGEGSVGSPALPSILSPTLIYSRRVKARLPDTPASSLLTQHRASAKPRGEYEGQRSVFSKSTNRYKLIQYHLARPPWARNDGAARTDQSQPAAAPWRQ